MTPHHRTSATFETTSIFRDSISLPMRNEAMPALFVTIPHSGEEIPPEASWLKGLPEAVQMCDVDRFVDQLYRPGLTELGIPAVIARWHRYAVDLNRLPEDFDSRSVVGATHVSGFGNGIHWVQTTKSQALISKPMSMAEHDALVEKYFRPFHREVSEVALRLSLAGSETVYHLDLHSMPSLGTAAHRDPGEVRAEVVVSDQLGRSSSPEFLELVVESFRAHDFIVAINWPYIGGRLTEEYGRPERGHHTIQVELRRNIYMDEVTKRIISELAEPLAVRLTSVMRKVNEGVQREMA